MAENVTPEGGLLLQSGCPNTGGRMLKEGSVAPKFSASDQHGNIVELEDLTGKWVALWWYPKASTPG